MYPPDDPARPFDETDEDRSESPEVGPEPENYTDVVSTQGPSSEPADSPDPAVEADPETGEIVHVSDPGVFDAALLPLADAPVTYQTLRAISRTEFVPAALRGRPEAVLAAVLYGRELGLGPMESLAHVDVIDGRPSPSAELLARLIRGVGHTVEVLEATDAACRLRGTRGDTGESLEVGFSLADAERVTTREKGQTLRLSETKRYREYPGDMCWARAISRLHRRLFPDVTTLSVHDERTVEGDPMAVR